jgi:hypothetical protein
MKIMRYSMLVAVLAATTMFVVGCSKKEETAGEKLDKAIRATENGAKKATEKTGEALERAGEKLQDAAK